MFNAPCHVRGCHNWVARKTCIATSEDGGDDVASRVTRYNPISIWDIDVVYRYG